MEISRRMHARICSVTELLFLHLSWPKPLLFVCSLFFFSYSLGCISCAVKKCGIPLSEPLDGHRPKQNCYKKLISTGGRMGFVTGGLGSAGQHLFAIAPRFTLALSGSTWLSSIYGLNRSKLRTYAKLNCLKWNCFWYLIVLMLNWIVKFRTVLTL